MTAAAKIAEARALIGFADRMSDAALRVGLAGTSDWDQVAGAADIYRVQDTVAALTDLAEAQARRIAELEAALRLHKAWADSEDTGPDYGGQTRDTHPDGERIWRQWWDGNLDLCARAQAATDAALGDTQ